MSQNRKWYLSLGSHVFVQEEGKSLQILGKVRQQGVLFFPEVRGVRLRAEVTEEKAKAMVEKAVDEEVTNDGSNSPRAA